jgi:hypothetical protein
MTWLERHRKYLLATQVQSALPQTIPGFPEGRTVVVWQLAKFMSMCCGREEGGMMMY